MRSFLQIYYDLSPSLVAVASDAQKRVPENAHSLRYALAAYEYEKQLTASRINHPEPRKTADVDAGQVPA